MATRLNLARALRRPRPWALRYVLVTLPSLALLLMFSVPLLPWFRLPLWQEAFQTRSLDGLLDVLMRPPVEMAVSPLVALGMLALPLVWLVVRALMIWIEGGILITYTQAEAPTGREFARVSSRWFGPFLLLALIGTVLTVVVAALVFGIAALAGMTLGPTATVLLVLLVLLVGGVRLWMELGRVSAVVRSDRNVLHALRDGSRLFGRYVWTVLALGLGSLALRLLLLWLGQLFLANAPWTWWLMTLVFQQGLQVVLIAVPLMRKAGEVSLARNLFPPPSVAASADV